MWILLLLSVHSFPFPAASNPHTDISSSFILKLIMTKQQSLNWMCECGVVSPQRSNSRRFLWIFKWTKMGCHFPLSVSRTCTGFIRRNCHEEEDTLCENQPSCHGKDCSLWHPGHCKVQVPADGLQMPMVKNKIMIPVILILSEFY